MRKLVLKKKKNCHDENVPKTETMVNSMNSSGAEESIRTLDSGT